MIVNGIVADNVVISGIPLPVVTEANRSKRLGCPLYQSIGWIQRYLPVHIAIFPFSRGRQV